MKRKDKDKFIQSIESVFIKNDFLILVNFKSMSASDSLVFRKSLKSAMCGMLVVKNTLARLALKRTGKFSYLLDSFSGPVALVYSPEIGEAAKLVVNFINTNRGKMSVICAAHANELLTVESINKLANLPSLGELRMEITRLLSYSIPSQLALSINSSSIKLVRILSYFSSKNKFII